VLLVLQFVCETPPVFLCFTNRISFHCLIMISMSLDIQRLCVAYSRVKRFVGSDDEDVRKSGVGRRELSQVRLKEVNHNFELDILTVAVITISQTSVEHICVISLYLLYVFCCQSFKFVSLAVTSFSIERSVCLKKWYAHLLCLCCRVLKA
jgi:hypothetical protein